MGDQPRYSFPVSPGVRMNERAHLTRSSDEWGNGTRPTLPRITGPIGQPNQPRGERATRPCGAAIKEDQPVIEAVAGERRFGTWPVDGFRKARLLTRPFFLTNAAASL